MEIEFRTRLDVMKTLTQLYKEFEDKAWNDNNYGFTAVEERAIVLKFLQTEYEDLVIGIMDDMLKTKIFDYDFAEAACNFDPELFKNIFQKAVIDNYATSNIDEMLRIVKGFKRFLPAIIGYESIYNVINSGTNKEECLKLGNEVQKMRLMKAYSQLPSDLKERVEYLANRLLTNS